ncbi:MAG: DNA-formamidopyrimidine glycosylase family protein [Acidobacteriota bacterium]
MPELPDVEVYLAALRPRVVGQPLAGVRLGSPFVLRSVSPPLGEAAGRTVVAVRRLGKRVVLVLEGELFLVIHLMIAGRLQWKPPRATIPRRLGLAAFDFQAGTLLLTEAGSKKRASLHLVAGEDALAEHDPGGLEVLAEPDDRLIEVFQAVNHTLKRALTDPHIFSGIGNAYSDEILHRARLSPFKQTRHLAPAEAERLITACRQVLTEWRDRLLSQTGDDFPTKVTAFRPEMAVHGRHRQPCPVCDAPVQRIVYAETECNYCPGCQTDGRILADRVLSKLLKDDWPKTLDELETHRGLGRSS